MAYAFRQPAGSGADAERVCCSSILRRWRKWHLHRSTTSRYLKSSNSGRRRTSAARPASRSTPRANLRAASRTDAADGVRSRRQFRPRLRRRPVRPAARAAHRCAGQHLGDRRRGSRGLQVQSVGRLEMVLGVKGRAGRDGTTTVICGCSTSRTRRWSAPNGEIFVLQGHGKGESRVAQVRQATATSSRAWGKKGKGPGEFDCRIRWCSMPRGCSTSPTATSAHPGVRRRRQLHPRIGAARHAVRPVHDARPARSGWRTATPARS